MPVRVSCSKCGCELAYYFKLPAHSSMDLWKPYFQKVREKYNGKCPKCGHILAHKPIEYKIRGLE